MTWQDQQPELPPGWSWATLGAVAATQLGKMLSKKAKTGVDERPYLRNQNVQWGRFHLGGLATMAFTDDEARKFELRAGDLVVCEGGEVGRCAVWPGASDVLYQKALHRVRPEAGVSAAYLMYALRRMADGNLFEGFTSGSTILHLPQEDLRRLPLPLAPAAEQRRIVDELERRLSHLDAAERNLRTAQRLILHCEDAVIYSALSGRLCADRTETTTASELRDALGAATIADDAFPELPGGWVLTTFGDVAELSLGKMLDKKRQTGDHPHPYLRNINVRWFRVDLDDLAVMDVAPQELERVRVRAGDLVVCEGGEPGRCAVWTGEPTVIQKALHRVRPKDGVEAAFLAVVLRWWSRQDRFDRFLTGTTIRHLPKERLRHLPVPLPPTWEQRSIAKEVARRLSLLAAAQEDVERGLQRVALLRRSLLAAAFAGHLVPQDRGEEPASALLERIRKERDAAAAAEKEAKTAARRAARSTMEEAK